MNRKGFTLIELLVVIAIIAILAAILFPVFASAREKARQISCASNEKQIALAIIQYTQDFDETFPIGNSLWTGPGGWNGSGAQNWAVLCVPYIKSNGVFACPDDSGAGAVFPKGTGFEGIAESYAANGLQWVWSATGKSCAGLMCETTDMGNGANFKGTTPVVSLSAVVEPSSVIMISEVYNSDLIKAGQGGNHTAWFNNIITGKPFYTSLAPPNQCGVATGAGTGPCNAPYPNGLLGAVSAHHSGLSNFAFSDGHVKAMNPLLTCPNNTVSAQWWTNGEYASNSMWFAGHTQ